MRKFELKLRIKQILERHKGRDRALTSKELAFSMGQGDDRQIRLIIRELIAEGLPVASSTEPPAGYFLVKNWQEARRYADSIKGRLIEDAIRRRDFNRSAALYLKPAEQGKLI